MPTATRTRDLPKPPSKFRPSSLRQRLKEQPIRHDGKQPSRVDRENSSPVEDDKIPQEEGSEASQMRNSLLATRTGVGRDHNEDLGDTGVAADKIWSDRSGADESVDGLTLSLSGDSEDNEIGKDPGASSQTCYLYFTQIHPKKPASLL